MRTTRTIVLFPSCGSLPRHGPNPSDQSYDCRIRGDPSDPAFVYDLVQSARNMLHIVIQSSSSFISPPPSNILLFMYVFPVQWTRLCYLLPSLTDYFPFRVSSPSKRHAPGAEGRALDTTPEVLIGRPVSSRFESNVALRKLPTAFCDP